MQTRHKKVWLFYDLVCAQNFPLFIEQEQANVLKHRRLRYSYRMGGIILIIHTFACSDSKLPILVINIMPFHAGDTVRNHVVL